MFNLRSRYLINQIRIKGNQIYIFGRHLFKVRVKVIFTSRWNNIIKSLFQNKRDLVFTLNI